MGLDISAGLVKVARDAASHERLDADFVVGDARQIRFDRAFDGAICLCEGSSGLAGSDDDHLAILGGVAKGG